ncbi:ATP-binding protein [Pelosinus sp. UFO1]|uniref:ATP-binding protein n=1 Tax=Pelosinus sp. UFO1 TaxID=484770 RepID=UPI0004D1D744|nr:ATP-binding protein [Pelosinus sp. UFO1]AIF52512.1 PAS/PAC sensor signal transduction histidine kinase [Pelosinus sp. UFO1]
MSGAIKEYIRNLKSTEEQLEKIIANNPVRECSFPDQVSVFDKQHRYLFVNGFGARYIGLKPSDMEGKERREIGLPHNEQLEQDLTTVFSTGQPVENELKDPQVTSYGISYFEYYLYPLYSSAGIVEAVLCTVRDITIRKLSQLSAVQSARDFNQLIDLCPFSVIMVDELGNFKNGNQAYIDLFFPGFTKEKLIGANPEFRTAHIGTQWKDSPLQKAVRGIAVRNVSKDIMNKQMLINAIPIRDMEGRNKGALAIFHDITEYEQMRHALYKMDRLNLIGEMATGVAHEIRNPMTVIKGYLQYLGSKVPASLNEQFDIVLGELIRIESIITDFLSLAGNTKIERNKHNINTIIRQAFPLVATDATKNNVVVDLCLEENLPDQLLSEKEIKQVLFNLTRNGIESMDDSGMLTIRTTLVDEQIVVTISDTGSGIAKEKLEKIFNPFYTTKDNGTGLGLAICESIINKHNGSIEVQSEEGRGSTFIISFTHSQGF